MKGTWRRCLALSLVGATAARDCGGSVTINSQSDADGLSDCKTFDGDVTIAASATGNMTFKGVSVINGDLRAEGGSTDGGGPTGITSKSITEIKGRLAITSLSAVESVSIPNLATVGGKVDVSDLPSLRSLNLHRINSVGSLRIASAPELVDFDVGEGLVGTEDRPDRGLKHITGDDPTVTIKDIGASDINKIFGAWNASVFELSGLPNLNAVLLGVGSVDDVRISGNGDLSLHMMEGGWTDYDQPVIGRLTMSGVVHVSPCLWPDVHEFVAVDNPIEYLHFGFRALRRLEVRRNANLRQIVPFNWESRFEWNLTDVVIEENPLLRLVELPPRAQNDTRTEDDCPFMWGDENGPFIWYTEELWNVAISGNVDNSFFTTLVGPWLDWDGEPRVDNDGDNDAYHHGGDDWPKWGDSEGGEWPELIIGPARIMKNLTISSTDPDFRCDQFDWMRSKMGAIPGEYSCQGKTIASGGEEAFEDDGDEGRAAGMVVPWALAGCMLLAGVL